MPSWGRTVIPALVVAREVLIRGFVMRNEDADHASTVGVGFEITNPGL